MSGYAWRKVCEKYLREHLSLSDGEISVMDGPEPSPKAGAIFVAIHPSDTRGTDADYYLREEVGVSITISVKGTQFPTSRWGEGVANDRPSAVEFLGERMKRLLHRNYSVMSEVNTTIAERHSPYYTPLRLLVDYAPVRRTATWWGSKESDTGQPIGLSKTLTFGEAEVVHSIEEIRP